MFKCLNVKCLMFKCLLKDMVFNKKVSSFYHDVNSAYSLLETAGLWVSIWI